MKRERIYLALVILIFVGFFSTKSAKAQNKISIKGDTLILNNEAKFWINEEVVFGQGTMPNKSYSYIYEAPTGFQKIVSDRKKKLLAPRYKGYKSKVIKFEKEIGHNKKEFNYNIIVLQMPEGQKYWCDVVNAFNNHEIQITASENNMMQVKDEEVKKGPANVSEELARLKKLLDDGSISREQYDLLKKNLLDSQKGSSATKRPKSTKAKPVSVF